MELMCDTVAIIQNGKLIDVRNLRDEQGSDALIEVAFEVNAVERAVELLGEEATVQGNVVVLSLSREQIPEVNAKLVREGVQVYGIRSVTRTLEDQFLQVTGGGGIG
jgi:ABC-2 type transport system ATP-binding protein